MAISEDTGNQPVAVHSATTSATTASFSPQANTLLVALLANDGSAAGAVVPTISDSLSGAWGSPLKLQNTANGSVGGAAVIWARYLSSAPGSMTVTATWSGTNGTAGGNFVVRCLLGAAQTQTGATAGNGGTSIAPTATLTPTVIGSWIYGAVLDYTTNAVMTANAQSAIVDQFNDSTNGDTWATLKGAASTSALSSTTYGATNANAMYNIAIAEILPAGGVLDSPFPMAPIFLPGDDPLGGIPAWWGAPDASHDVIVNAGTASLRFETPSSLSMLMLALTSESGIAAQGLSVETPFAGSPDLLTPDDPLGGMQPWGGAVDAVASSAVTANAGAASMSFTAQSPSDGLAVTPGTGSIALTSNGPTSAVGALPGVSTVSLAGQTPSVAIAPTAGASSLTFTARSDTAAIAPTAGASSLTFAGQTPSVSIASTAGAASLAFTAQSDTAGIAPTAGAASVVFAGQQPSVPGATTVNAGVASVSFTAQSPSAGLSSLPGTGSITLTANGAQTALGVLPGTPSVSLTARSPSDGITVLPGFSSVSFTAFQASVPGATNATAGVASVSFGAQSPAAGAGVTAGVSAMTLSARAPGPGVSALPAVAVVSVSAVGASVVLPQTGVPTVISGREGSGQTSGREPSTSFSGQDTGGISGRQTLSSTSGTEPSTSIKGRES